MQDAKAASCIELFEDPMRQKHVSTFTICMAAFGTTVASALGMLIAMTLLSPQSDDEGAGFVQPAQAQAPKTPPARSAQTPPVAEAQPAAAPPAQPLQMPPPETLLILLRSALTALNLSNAADNYQLLHSMCSPAVQARFSPSDIRATFANLRVSGMDLSPVLVLTPQLTAASGITPLGVLRLVGFFPTQPMRIMFALEFSPIGGRWRIETISVVGEPVTAAQPVAQAPAAAVAPAPAAAAPVKSSAAKKP